MGQILERPLAPTRRPAPTSTLTTGRPRPAFCLNPHRIELIDGEIIDMPVIGSPYAAITNRLARLLTRALSDEVALVSVQSPLRLDAYNEPEPDLMLLRPRPDGYRASHPGAANVFLLDRSVGKLTRLRSGRQACALRKIRRSGGLDRRSVRRRGRGLSSRERLTGGLLGPALVAGVTIDLARILA